MSNKLTGSIHQSTVSAGDMWWYCSWAGIKDNKRYNRYNRLEMFGKQIRYVHISKYIFAMALKTI